MLFYFPELSFRKNAYSLLSIAIVGVVKELSEPALVAAEPNIKHEKHY